MKNIMVWKEAFKHIADLLRHQQAITFRLNSTKPRHLNLASIMVCF